MYTHPLLGDLLDSGEIDFILLNFFEEIYKISKAGNLVIHTGKNDYAEALLGGSYTNASDAFDPRTEYHARVFRALFDLNILYKSKYFDILHLEHAFYRYAVLEHIQDVKSQMSQKENLQYQVFRRTKGLVLGNR